MNGTSILKKKKKQDEKRPFWSLSGKRDRTVAEYYSTALPMALYFRTEFYSKRIIDFLYMYIVIVHEIRAMSSKQNARRITIYKKRQLLTCEC